MLEKYPVMYCLHSAYNYVANSSLHDYNYIIVLSLYHKEHATIVAIPYRPS